jgi:hypothetical protein
MMMMEKIACTCLLVGIIAVSALSSGNAAQPSCSVGVWNNFEFGRDAEDWSTAAHKFGGENGVIDLVVAQANIDGLTYLPFPYERTGYLYSSSQTDKVEPYLAKFDSEGLKVILSIQPLRADVPRLLETVLARYGHHECLIGVNIDLEWKETGTPNHVSNEERDIYLTEIKRHNPKLKLFLTYFKDYTYFPADTRDLVILFDGEDAAQADLLRHYQELADHYATVGIYTGFSSSAPPTASYDRIMAAVPNTEYIIHTEDVFSNKTVVIFEMDDVQVDWLESTSIDLINLHLQKSVPVVCGVIPNNLDNPDVGGGFLPSYLKDSNDNSFDICEVAQHGYTHNLSEDMSGKSYEEQKMIIDSGLKILTTIGIKPTTFVPPYGAADETTIKAAEDLGFKTFVSFSPGSLASDKLLVIDSWISLLDTGENGTALKSPEQLMAEIDQSSNKVVIVVYNIFDFQPDSGTTIEELGTILDSLKASGNYQFMTTRAYHESLEYTFPPSGQTPPHWPTIPDWSLYVIVGALVIAALVLFVARRAGWK